MGTLAMISAGDDLSKRDTTEDADASGRFTSLSDEGKRKRVTVWQRFIRHRLAAIGLIILATLALLSVAAPVLTPHSPRSTDMLAASEPPSRSHWLGTDRLGRDVLTRILYAGRVSLAVGLAAVAIFTIIGIILGAVAGFFGGWVDSVVMRFTDVVLSFPAILIIITAVAVMGPSVVNLTIVIGLLSWPPVARLLRGDLLSIRERDFIMAARSIGTPGGRLVFRHMLPNAMAPIIVAATFGVASTILLEAGLSFLGLGVQPPTPSWGNMLTDAQSLSVLANMYWLWVPPGLMIALAVLAINFVGDGLRDALDPYLYR